MTMWAKGVGGGGVGVRTFVATGEGVSVTLKDQFAKPGLP
jgi:hypothetical protein